MTEGDTATVANGTGDGTGDGSGEGSTNLNSTNTEHDPYFEPIVTLPEVVVSTMEEDEDEMIKLRARLFRFDSSVSPAEWKDRGTGDVKLLRHRTRNTVRVVMRREKTLKICANHFVTPWMELTPNCGSDRAWVWSSKSDFADETPRPELLAIRFANTENAQRWKEKFEEAKAIVAEHAKENESEESDSDDQQEDKKDCPPPAAEKNSEEVQPEQQATAEVTEQLEKLNVADKEKQGSSSSEKE